MAQCGYFLRTCFVLHEWPPRCALHLSKSTPMYENWKLSFLSGPWTGNIIFPRYWKFSGKHLSFAFVGYHECGWFYICWVWWLKCFGHGVWPDRMWSVGSMWLVVACDGEDIIVVEVHVCYVYGHSSRVLWADQSNLHKILFPFKIWEKSNSLFWIIPSYACFWTQVSLFYSKFGLYRCF